MTERLDRNDPGRTKARGRDPRSGHEGIGGAPPLPAPPPSYFSAESRPTLLGFPTDGPGSDERGELTRGAREVSPSSALIVVRRPDPLGAAALVLAGAAASSSLVLPWPPGDGPTGLALVQRGAGDLGSGPVGDALWQPFVVVMCGGLLVALGFLMMIPARAHRLVGVLTLVVALAAAAAVVTLIAETDLADERFGPGLWCAAAVPVLGLLGAMKAMLTVPLVSLARPGRGRRSGDAAL
ncbi:MAG: hypothetical protein AVDCRST_MAG57-1424 [uncultured Blastococcus sp.]|uniref:Uncharacterized protein n=1 Tax=uncultured Blastococcus sp. TaxID=217144 RepID=A0A6J4I0X4_9ACTN|nr:MAG: hypothetical protein AVDCRST_MAG57-1424 [uncultured Blastococcus sp.]